MFRRGFLASLFGAFGLGDASLVSGKSASSSKLARAMNDVRHTIVDAERLLEITKMKDDVHTLALARAILALADRVEEVASGC